MMLPNYDMFFLIIIAPIGHVGIIYASTDMFVRFAVRGIRSIRLQHHISKLSANDIGRAWQAALSNATL